jgi:tRNA(fMet)-specific endonuclease VapC
VVKAELYFGARHSASVDGHLELLHEFFQPIPSLAFDDRSAAEYGAIRAGLQAAGMTIGPHDLQIASIARAADLTVLTANVREFVRVPGLRVESTSAL